MSLYKDGEVTQMEVYWAVILILIMFGIGAASVLEAPEGNRAKKRKRIDRMLVFGNARLAGELKRLGFAVEYLPARPEVSQLDVYDAVLALSDDDMENMRLCVEASHLDPNTLTVIRCMDQAYLSALKDSGVGFVVNRDVTAKELEAIIGRKKWPKGTEKA